LPAYQSLHNKAVTHLPVAIPSIRNFSRAVCLFPGCVGDVAEAAATRSAQEASAFCSSGAIQGTSSSILLPLHSLTQQMRQPASRLQQQMQQHWQQQLQQDGSAALCESAVLSGMKFLKLQRRLASCRLHRCANRLMKQPASCFYDRNCQAE
jgi:hypothetical protein